MATFLTTQHLPLTFEPGAPILGNLVWTTSDNTVATVSGTANSNNAVVSPVNAGSATISVSGTGIDNVVYEGSIPVTVTVPSSPATATVLAGSPY
jgi:hypothetical protein